MKHNTTLYIYVLCNDNSRLEFLVQPLPYIAVDYIISYTHIC